MITCTECECCDHARTDAETGAGYCRIYGEMECPRQETAERLDALAEQIAALIAQIPDATTRKELAASCGEGFDNAIYETGLHAEFNASEFAAACGCYREMAA